MGDDVLVAQDPDPGELDLPEITRSARSRTEAAFARLRPQAASASGGVAMTRSAVTSPSSASSNLLWMVSAARPASCWKTMDRARAAKRREGRTGRRAGGRP